MVFRLLDDVAYLPTGKIVRRVEPIVQGIGNLRSELGAESFRKGLPNRRIADTPAKTHATG